MATDCQPKKVYRLVGITAPARVRGHLKNYGRAAHSRAARCEREKAEAVAKKLGVDVSPAPPKPAKLLCQSKLNTLKDVYLLALGEAGAFTTDARNPRTISRDEALKKAGLRRKPQKPKRHYDNVAPQLRLRTSQASMAATCGCAVRTLQRHLDDFEEIGLVVVRQQLGVDRYGSPSFQMVLDAAFLDWKEILLNSYGVAADEGPDSAPVSGPSAGTAPDVPPPPIDAPKDVFKALTALEQMEALRKKMSAPFTK